MSYGAETEADALLTSLTTGLSFTLPTVDLDDPLFKLSAEAADKMYAKVVAPTTADLTSGTVGGSGVFDALMASVSAHLKVEYDKSRITGNEYTQAYIQMTQSAMQMATQFLLGREQAFWQAQQAQIAAINGRIVLETTKVQLAGAQLAALTAKAQFALSKLKLANESVTYGIATYNLASIMPAQLAGETAKTSLLGSQKLGQDGKNSIDTYNLATFLPAQKLGIDYDNQTKTYNLNYIMIQQRAKLESEAAISAYNLAYTLPAQLGGIQAQTAGETYKTSSLLPGQVGLLAAQSASEAFKTSAILPKQALLLSEQSEAARAQTGDVRIDGPTIGGLIKRQRDLYEQQILSYKRDAELKLAKLFSDAWTVQKTIDEATTPPSNFTNAYIDDVLTNIRINNGV